LQADFEVTKKTTFDVDAARREVSKIVQDDMRYLQAQLLSITPSPTISSIAYHSLAVTVTAVLNLNKGLVFHPEHGERGQRIGIEF